MDQQFDASQVQYSPAPIGNLSEHPRASNIFIGWFFPVFAFMSWYMAAKVKKEIENGAPYNWGGAIMVGYYFGMVVSIIYIITSLFVVLVLLLIPVALFFGSGNNILL